MKKSKLVRLGLLAATSLVVMACDDNQPQEIRHCVNEQGVVVDESFCAPLDNPDGGDPSDSGLTVATDDAGNPIVVPRTTVVVPDGPPVFLFYHWYYGGGYTRPLAPGTRIIINGRGYGSWRPSPGRVYVSPRGGSWSLGGGGSSIGRGGFGGTGRGFSGGGVGS